jgi:predicted DNA binding protein
LMFSRYLSEKKLTDVDTNVASIKKLMCGSYKPNDQFFSIFNEENDARYTEAFDSVMYDKVNSTRKTLVLKKIWRSNGDCPMCYMRLAQMYLFKAEALATSGASVKEVLAPLNVLRERSGNELYDEKDFTDRDELIKAVFNETVREIGLENGSEFFVAARMRLASGKRLLTEYNSIFRDDKQLAWQIPDDEMKYNILMVANPIFAQE